jgi:hypothetical protein
MGRHNVEIEPSQGNACHVCQYIGASSYPYYYYYSSIPRQRIGIRSMAHSSPRPQEPRALTHPHARRFERARPLRALVVVPVVAVLGSRLRRSPVSPRRRLRCCATKRLRRAQPRPSPPLDTSPKGGRATILPRNTHRAAVSPKYLYVCVIYYCYSIDACGNADNVAIVSLNISTSGPSVTYEQY